MTVLKSGPPSSALRAARWTRRYASCRDIPFWTNANSTRWENTTPPLR